MAFTPGAPAQRPAEGYAVIAVEGAMASKLRRLRCTGIVLTAPRRGVMPAPAVMQRALNQQLRIPIHNIAVSKHMPGDFFARFDHPDQAEQAVRRGIVDVAGTDFLIQPWREDSHSKPSD